jgi:hypothetical protein
MQREVRSGSKSEKLSPSNIFRVNAESGHGVVQSTRRKGAKKRHGSTHGAQEKPPEGGSSIQYR